MNQQKLKVLLKQKSVKIAAIFIPVTPSNINQKINAI